MKSVNRLSLKAKMFRIIFLPLLALSVLVVLNVQEKQNIYKEMSQLNALTELSVKIANVVHESQKERGYTAGFLGSKGVTFSKELVVQRTNTDTQIQNLNIFLKNFDYSVFDKKMNAKFETAMNDLNQIESKRKAISAINISGPQAIDYYTNMNCNFLDAINQTVHLSKNSEISNLLTSYVNFLQGKERAGIERAVLTNTFVRNSFSSEYYTKFMMLVSQQKTYTDVFLSLATDAQVQYYKSKVSGNFVDEVNKMRKIAIEKNFKGNFGVDANYWFKMSTGRINLLSDVSKELATNLQSRTASLGEQAKGEFITIVVISLIVIAATLLTGLFTINSIIGPINQTVDKLNFSSNQTTTTAGQIAEASLQLSDGAVKQAESLEETSSSLEEMSSMTKQNSDNTTEANRLAQMASAAADDGSHAMDDMQMAMSVINESAKKISTIIDTIEKIAFQTNLLALNAAVETARAGDHGKGFAVVVEEVRSLAKHTTIAVGDTVNLIEDCLTKTQNGHEIASNAAKSLDNIITNTKKVAGIINEIAVANREQAEGIEQVNIAVNQMNQVTQVNVSMAEASSASSSELSLQAKDLNGIITELQQLVQG